MIAESKNDLFGQSVSGTGDVNGDGYDDVIIGAPFDIRYGTDFGSAWVISLVPPTVQLENIVQDVVTLNIQEGINNSLDTKIQSSLTALDDLNVNNDVAAVNSLEAFINATEAQRGNKISVEDADGLIANARRAINNLKGN